MRGERLLYLPAIGFAALAVCALDGISRRLGERQSEFRYAAAAALSLILISFAARTYSRNADWLDPGRFWRTSLEAAPGSFKTNLAAAINTPLLSQQDWNRTVTEVDHGLAILANLPDGRNAGIGYRPAV